MNKKIDYSTLVLKTAQITLITVMLSIASVFVISVIGLFMELFQ